jgi:hypothetical protein
MAIPCRGCGLRCPHPRTHSRAQIPVDVEHRGQLRPGRGRRLSSNRRRSYAENEQRVRDGCHPAYRDDEWKRPIANHRHCSTVACPITNESASHAAFHRVLLHTPTIGHVARTPGAARHERETAVRFAKPSLLLWYRCRYFGMSCMPAVALMESESDGGAAIGWP